jgi:F-type H+-transporting ATPase subunit a
MLFFFIMFSNIFGLLPFGYTVTSLIIIPFFFSIINFIFTSIIGLKKYKFFIFAGFLPAGTNIFIAPLLIIIEVISYFIKLFSLAVRLFANMFAGHVLVKVLLSLIVTLYLNCTFIASAAALIIIFLVFAILILEVFICCLQAYVFINLASVYLAQVVGFIQH